LPTTPPPTASRPDEGVVPYDWSDPEAYRPPAADGDSRHGDSGHGDSGHGDFGHHAFWERLPFPGVPWRRVLTIGLVCFGLWFLLDAPSLQHSAQVSPLGSRRTVSLDVVGPMAALSRTLGLSSVVGSADRALGRTPGGGPALAVPTRRPRLKPIPVTGITSPTSTTLPPLDHHPTPSMPLKVLIVGDSVGLDLGQPLVNTLASYGDVITYLDGRIDTGLSRPDYFDWPAELQIDLTNQQPDLVVVMIGANDPQGLVTPDGSLRFGQPGWDAAYSARVAAFIAEANRAGVHVLWVGMPPMRDPGLNAALMHLNDLVQIQVAQVKDHGASFLSSTPSLVDKKGAYAAFLPDTAGAEVNVRTPDGIHLTPGGGARLATAVAGAMQTQLHVHLVFGKAGAGSRT
jgi:lysophospholipase L1-like esterase